MLSVIIFFPAISAILGFLIENKSIKFYGASIALIELLLTLFICFNVDFKGYDFVLTHQVPLIPSLNISYFVGIDTISLVLIVLSAFMSFISIAALSDDGNLKHLIISVLFLETTMMGVFSALDMILFYSFWELSLIPLLYIIGAFGSKNRIYAAIKFFIYTFLGSVFMLVAIIFIGYLCYQKSGVFSFSLLDWYKLGIGQSAQIWLFLAFFFAFGVKTPLFPFHTWLPYAHGQAPTIGSVLLASVLLKMGTYGFVRFSLPLFPDASLLLSGFVCVIAIIMIIYAALVAYVQSDMKQVIAYSSISHMGVVSGALFLLVGVIYERAHTKEICEFGGLAKVIPKYALVFFIATLASIGLPLTIGFVGEFLSLLGVFKLNKLFALLGGFSIIVGAIYMLVLYKRVFFGECKKKNLSLKDLNFKELAALVPLCLLIIALGIAPNLILKPLEPSVQNIISKMQTRAVNSDTKDKISSLNGGSKL